MSFGLETIHRNADIAIVVNKVYIIIEPQIELPQEIKDEIQGIKNIPGYRLSSYPKCYYITPATTSDKLAIAERISIGLEEKGLRVSRVIDKCIEQILCQSFILA